MSDFGLKLESVTNTDKENGSLLINWNLTIFTLISLVNKVPKMQPDYPQYLL